ncbi:MAG: hypothetical protein ACRDL3_09015, partial [Solirubrobacterales bacterium]
MSRNGRRRPPRPRIEAIAPSPASAEAAAITAAIERFLADTAPPPAPAPQHQSAWQRAALREAVSGRAELGTRWG